jgi:hypothetical protein
MYQMVINFNYIEVEGSDTTYKSMKMAQPVNSISASQNSNNDEITKGFSVATFYELLANTIEPTDRDIKRYARMPNCMSFNLIVTDENYYTYSQVSAPSSGIVQHKPSFSNVACSDGTDAFGLVAARNNVYVNARFGKATLDSLSKGIYTSNLKFAPWTDGYYSPYITN